MDVMMVIYLVIAALIGCAVGYFLLQKSNDKQVSDVSDTQNSKLEAEQQRISEAYEQKIQECQKYSDALKQKYESLLADANTEIKGLKEKIQLTSSGDMSGVIQQQLDEIEQLKDQIQKSASKYTSLQEELEKSKRQLPDIEKYKKQIKKLEEEIDDYEDDLDDYKKKLKKKEEENTSLRDQLSKEEHTNKQLASENTRIQEELTEKKNALNLKGESLAFVQEILSAKQTDDVSTKALYSQVDNLANYISGELRDCVTSIFKIENTSVFEGELYKWAITKKKAWIQGKTTIAFVGEFSAGKTSIVNRILSQDDPRVPLLPVSTKATTAIPTYISGGVSTRYNFVTPDNIQKSISEETFKRVNKEVLDQVKGVSSLIQYFVMTYKNPHLDRLSILDTPGFNSNDKEDASRTIGVINECDALFWVFDVNAGTVNRTSIQLIKENLHKPLYVVINKVDTKAETEVNKVEQLIRKTLRDSGISVQQFIRFSAKAPLQTIMKPIQSIPSNIEQEDYLSSVYNWICALEQRLIEDEKTANNKQLSLFKQCNSLVDKYADAIGRLRDNCEYATDIPHYETHIFSSDKYEMSETEYNQLVHVLDTIRYDRVSELCQLYDEQMDAQREAQQAYSDYIDEKYNWQKMNTCKEQLSKLIKQLQ